MACLLYMLANTPLATVLEGSARYAGDSFGVAARKTLQATVCDGGLRQHGEGRGQQPSVETGHALRGCNLRHATAAASA